MHVRRSFAAVTADLNRSTWSAAVGGPIVVIGTDPIFHQSQGQANQLTSNAIAFAASGASTGMYMSLSCYYGFQSSTVDVLADFGTFVVDGQGTGGLSDCPDDVGILDPAHPVVQGITVNGIANWGCSIHEAFASYPSAFAPIAQDNPTGLPYIVATPGAGGKITDAPSRYAPFVYIHPGEHAYPNPASDFISHSRLRWSHDSCRDHAVENPDGSDASYDAIDQSRLGEAAATNAYSHPENGSFCLHSGTIRYANDFTRPRDGNPERVTSGSEGMFLDLQNGQHGGNTNLSTDPVYYDFVDEHYVVYWFFYNYNDYSFHGIINEKHEGDWEHVVVHLDSTNHATEVAYYRHGCDPEIISWSDLQAGDGVNFGLVQDTHPIVFSAKGGHGSYAKAGSYGPSSCQGPDEAQISSATWQTWSDLLEVHSQPWYGYGGAWGEVGNFEITTGPLGPSKYKGSGAPSGW